MTLRSMPEAPLRISLRYEGRDVDNGTMLIDLPIPLIIGPSVWNRPFHFFFAWVLVLTGLTYVVGSL